MPFLSLENLSLFCYMCALAVVAAACLVPCPFCHVPDVHWGFPLLHVLTWGRRGLPHCASTPCPSRRLFGVFVAPNSGVVLHPQCLEGSVWCLWLAGVGYKTGRVVALSCSP